MSQYPRRGLGGGRARVPGSGVAWGAVTDPGCRRDASRRTPGIHRHSTTHRPEDLPRALALLVVDLTLALLAIAALVVVATAVGLLARARQGRARAVDSAEVVDPRRLGADALGEEATLLQFSTEMCSRCPQVHRMLSEVADARDGVRHLDVDLTHRPDIAQHFRVLQTPTTLVLDRRGIVRTRFGGTPGRAVVELELDTLQKEASRA